jgi:hypothetical protein
MYSKRQFGQPYQVELGRLSKELLVARKNARKTFLRSVLQNEGSCWTESKKFSDHIGNRTRNLSACSAVPQPSTPPRFFLRIVGDMYCIRTCLCCETFVHSVDN